MPPPRAVAAIDFPQGVPAGVGADQLKALISVQIGQLAGEAHLPEVGVTIAAAAGDTAPVLARKVRDAVRDGVKTDVVRHTAGPPRTVDEAIAQVIMSRTIAAWEPRESIRILRNVAGWLRPLVDSTHIFRHFSGYRDRGWVEQLGAECMGIAAIAERLQIGLDSPRLWDAPLEAFQRMHRFLLVLNREEDVYRDEDQQRVRAELAAVTNPRLGDGRPANEDVAPNRGRPLHIPEGAKLHDLRNMWSATAWARMYTLYNLRGPRVGEGELDVDWVILGGNFVNDIRSMSEIVGAEQRTRNILATEAGRLAGIRLTKDGETHTFDHGAGPEIITSDTGMFRASLTLGRFSLWWEARTRVGPRRARPQQDYGPDAPPQAQFEADWVAEVRWTFQDLYDFDFFGTPASWPHGWVGTPYRVQGSWQATERGKVSW